MTIIAAAEDKRGYWIGSDSTSICGNTMEEHGPKLIYKGNYIIGFSGSYRVKDIITEGKDFPKTMNSIRSLRKFRDVLKKKLIEDGCNPIGTDNYTVMHPVCLILVSCNGIYTIDTDYQIHKVNSYAATGSGMDFALGALRTGLETTESAVEAVRLAIESTIFHCTTCGGDIYIDHILKKGK
jgi:ATP-dependent protease HslVU (ClpYQ) peptidase subunit